MEFFNQAIDILKILVMALGACAAYGASSTFWKVTGRITLRQNHRALSSSWLIRCNKSGERKSTIQTEPAV